MGLCLPNTPYFPIFYFAALKIGAIIVNYNPLYTERELTFQIKDSGTTVMVTVDLALVYPKLARIGAEAGLRKIIVCPFASAGHEPLVLPAQGGRSPPLAARR